MAFRKSTPRLQSDGARHARVRVPERRAQRRQRARDEPARARAAAADGTARRFAERARPSAAGSKETLETIETARARSATK